MRGSVVQLILCQLSVEFRVSIDNMSCYNCCPRHFMPHFSSFTKFPRSNTKAHWEAQIEKHLNLALRSHETTQRQVKDRSQQIEQLISKDKYTSQQIERLIAQVKVQDRHIKFLNSPPFTWKISNSQVAYQRIVNRGENIIRSTFYLSSTGTDWESKFCRMPFLPVPSGPHSLLSCLINPFLFISVLFLGNF